MIVNKHILKYFLIRNAGGTRNEAHRISSSSVHVLYLIICVRVEN